MLAYDLSSLMQMATDFEFRKTYGSWESLRLESSSSETSRDFVRMAP